MGETERTVGDFEVAEKLRHLPIADQYPDIYNIRDNSGSQVQPEVLKTPVAGCGIRI